MQIQHIALVPEHDRLDAAELTRVSAALQKQVLRDLAPIWSITASVDVFLRLEDVPLGSWPIVVTSRDLGGRSGVHIDRNGQPFAHVEFSPTWSLDASRACLDMLTNPFERRTVTARSPRPDQLAVEFLVEVAAPCEDARHAYAIDDVLVADFCTPEYFAPRPSRGARYTFADAVAAPLQLLPGGHLTWFDARGGSWWLRSHRGPNPIDTDLGAVNRNVVSLRELVLACAPARAPASALAQRIATLTEQNRLTGRQRAERLRALLDRKFDADLRAAFDALQRVPEPAPVTRQHEIEIPLDFLADEDVLTLERDERVVQRPVEVTTPRSTSRPPMPQATRTATATRSRTTPTLPWSEPSADALSVAPVLRTLPSAPRPASSRGGLLVAGGAIAGAAAAVALVFAARGAVAPTSVASFGSAPVPAPVASAPAVPTPAIAVPVAVLAAPTPVIAAAVAGAPGGLQPPTAKPDTVARVAATPARKAQKATAPRRDLPAPQAAPEASRDSALADPLDALLGSNH